MFEFGRFVICNNAQALHDLLFLSCHGNHVRHLKGKVFVLLENAKVAVFRRFAGTCIDNKYLVDFMHIYCISQMEIGIGTIIN